MIIVEVAVCFNVKMEKTQYIFSPVFVYFACILKSFCFSVVTENTLVSTYSLV